MAKGGGKGSRAGGKGRDAPSSAASAKSNKAEERELRNNLKKERQKGKHSKQEEDEEMLAFAAQLRPLGLQIREIQGDGNCLFRSLSDQMYGSCFRHQELRKLVCDYIESHEDEFAPFFDETMSLKRHVALLRKLGTYGGNDSLVAFARAQGCNVVVHQVGQPRWAVHGSDKPDAPELHIAYHDWEHYSSIRRIAGDMAGSANIRISQDAVKKVKDSIAKSDPSKKKDASSAGPSVDERVVMSATGIKDVVYVREVLEDHSGDVEAAITYLLQMEELAPPQPPASTDPQPTQPESKATQPESKPPAVSTAVADCGSSSSSSSISNSSDGNIPAAAAAAAAAAANTASASASLPATDTLGSDVPDGGAETLSAHNSKDQTPSDNAAASPSPAPSKASSDGGGEAPFKLSKLQIKRMQKAEKKADKLEKKSQKLKERMGLGVPPTPLPTDPPAGKVDAIVDISGTLGQLTI